MKKALLIIVFLAGTLAHAQSKQQYLRLGKLTSTEIDNVDTTDTTVVYTAYDTTLGIEVINVGAGWVPRISAGAMNWAYPINANITVDTDQAYSIGSATHKLLDIYAASFEGGSFIGSAFEGQHALVSQYVGFGNNPALDPSGHAASGGLIFWDDAAGRFKYGEGGTSTIGTFALNSELSNFLPYSGGTLTSHLTIGDGSGTGASLLIRDYSTDGFSLAFNRTNTGSYIYDTKAYNDLTLGRLNISSSTGQGEYLGGFKITGLAGSGDRMVVANSLGVLGTQAIPSGGGTGNVTKVGTPVNNQLAVWTGDGTLKGTEDIDFNGSRVLVKKPIILEGPTGNASISAVANGSIYFQPDSGWTYFNKTGLNNKFYAFNYTIDSNTYLTLDALNLTLQKSGVPLSHIKAEGRSFLTNQLAIGKNTGSNQLDVLGNSSFDGNTTTTGSATANSFIKTGGTADQILLADGTTASKLDLDDAATLNGRSSTGYLWNFGGHGGVYNWNNMLGSGMYTMNQTNDDLNAPFSTASNTPVFQMAGGSTFAQLAVNGSSGNNAWWVRTSPDSGATWAAWKELGAGGSSMTNEEVRDAYEANADRNAYTDADKATVGNLTASGPIDLDGWVYEIANITLKAPKLNPTFSGNVVVPTADADGEAVNLGQLNAALTAANLLGTETATSSRTAVLEDADGVLQVTNASATTYTIPTNATTAFPVGTIISIKQMGAGNVTLAYAGGVTGEAGETGGKNNRIVIRKTGTDTWEVFQHPTHLEKTAAQYAGLTPIDGVLYVIID